MLVMSARAFNAWRVRLVVVVPITTRDRGFGHHVPVAQGGLEKISFAMPEYVRSIAQHRLRRRLGMAAPSTIGQVGDWLRRITEL